MEEFKSKKDSFKNAICYVPFVAIFLNNVLDEKSISLQRNIRYGISLLIFYIILLIILKIFLGFLPIGFTSLMFYLIISFIYGFKAYIGNDIRIGFFDKFYDLIKSNKN